MEEDDVWIRMVTDIPDTNEKMACIKNCLVPIKSEVRRADYMLFYAVIPVSDRVLEEWAKSLINSVLYNESCGIKDAANALVEEIFTQEQNCYFRWRNGCSKEEIFDEEELFNKWQKLRSLVYDGFSDLHLISDKVKGELGLLPKAETDFRLKYDRYIDDMDTFLVSLKNKKGKALKAFYDKHIKPIVTFKEFFADCAAIVPERKGERGWNYEAIKKY